MVFDTLLYPIERRGTLGREEMAIFIFTTLLPHFSFPPLLIRLALLYKVHLRVDPWAASHLSFDCDYGALLYSDLEEWLE